MKNNITLLALSLMLILSCDKIDDPIPSNIGQTIEYQGISYILDKSFEVGNINQLEDFLNKHNWADTVIAPDNSTQRFITLEEYTGHKCQFCPIGTKELLRLKGIYGDQLIPIGIHAGTFALPKSSGTEYTTDLRDVDRQGDQYLTQFNPGDSYPRGTVSRLGDVAVSHNEWEKDIKLIKDDSPLVILKMTNIFDQSSMIVRSNIEINWLDSIPEDFSLQVFVLEDHIIDWQLDATSTPNDIPDYDHRHVLRKVVNGTYGKSLLQSGIGKTEIIEYIFPLNVNIVPNNFHNNEVVAFIFESDPSSLDVIQANAAHIK